MKKLNKIALLTIVGLTAINNQTKATASNLVVAAMVTKTVEEKMFACVNSYISHFSDLTISNVKSKKQHIENMRKDLLSILKDTPGHQYKDLQKMLEKLDINQVLKAISDFKEILKKLPKESSKLIEANVKDSMTRRILGF